MDPETWDINGSKLSLKLKLEAAKALVMKNEERFRITSDCVFANVKRIVGEPEDKVYGMYAEAKLTSCMQNGLNDVRKFYTLEKALRTMVNMVPEPETQSIGDMHYHLLHNCNIYQP